MKYIDFYKNYQIENIFELKDGRELVTTNNGFKFWLVDKKKNVSEITEEYFNISIKHAILKNGKRC